jgi:hypothetical protein
MSRCVRALLSALSSDRVKCVDHENTFSECGLTTVDQNTTDGDAQQLQGVLNCTELSGDGGRLECMRVGMSERRASTRFPIRSELQFKTSNKRFAIISGTGRTVNISSSGLLFESNSDLALGSSLELSIEWPVRLNEKCLLRLIAKGRIVRQNNRQFAVEVLRYEFRTHAASKKSALGSSEWQAADHS